MEAVKKMEEEIPDERTDLEELEDLAVQIRLYRRKIDKMALDAIKSAIKGSKIDEGKSEEIIETRKWLTYLEKSYNSLMKICYPKGKITGGGIFSDTKAPLTAVKNEKSSVGDIITTIPQESK